MEVKGNLTVASIVTAGRRVNENLVKTTLVADLELNKYSSKHQYLVTATQYNLVLPDATTLPTGWCVYFYNSADSTDRLLVTDHTGTSLHKLSPKKSTTFILLENQTEAGVWIQVQSGKGGGLGTGNVLLYSASDIATGTTNTFTLHPFVANVMDGVDEAGDVVDETVFLEADRTITITSPTSTTKFIYIDIDGNILEETSRQQGGNVFPAAPVEGDIFFHKPLRRNYKYSSTNGWEPYPCTSVCELAWDGNGTGIAKDYPKNEWWWDYKYGEKRNTSVVSSGTVLTIPDLTGKTIGEAISGVLVGNLIVTVADGYTPAGLAIDRFVPITFPKEVSYTLGTAYYYYVRPDGTVYSSTHGQRSGKDFPADLTTYTSGDMFYNIQEGRNYQYNGTTFVPFPAVLVATISEDGTGRVYPFNSPSYEGDMVLHTQFFLDATNPTTSVHLDFPVEDPQYLTVNVSNTVLQSNTYTLAADKQTILFTNPIEAGLQIEARWYVPANAVVVKNSYVGTASVSDFNNFSSSSTLYTIIHTTKDVTLHPPLNVTADWLVLCVDANGIIYMQASQLDQPEAVLYRVKKANGVWTDWNFSYGSWFPGV